MAENRPLPDVLAPFGSLIDRTAATFQLDGQLLRAQILVESSGNPWAFRYEPAFFTRYIRHNPHAKGFLYGPLAACSYGLLQILLETALELGYPDRPEHLFVPDTGLVWGARYLKKCLNRSHDDVFTALQLYNGSGDAALAYAHKVFTTAGRPV